MRSIVRALGDAKGGGIMLLGVESFLRDLMATLRSNENFLALLVIDQDRSQLLYETAISLYAKEILVKDAAERTTAGTEKSFFKVTDFRYVHGGIQGWADQ